MEQQWASLRAPEKHDTPSEKVPLRDSASRSAAQLSSRANVARIVCMFGFDSSDSAAVRVTASRL